MCSLGLRFDYLLVGSATPPQRLASVGGRPLLRSTHEN